MSTFESQLPAPPFAMTPCQIDDAKASAGDVIVYGVGPVSAEHVEAFRRATATESYAGIPPTFLTFLRWGEFKWLRRLGIDLRQLLHTEQEYEYLARLELGDRIEVQTRVMQDRERRGMRFITLETSAICDGTTKLIGRTSFVIRSGETA